MEIGWAVDKGLDVLKTSYQVYKAFNDPHSNAPQQFRDLSAEFSAFHVVFEELLEVLKQHNKPVLVSLTSIEYTLKKCRLFQEKFGVLNEVATKRTIKQGIAFGLRTLQWSFLAEKVSNELRRELASHSRILSLYTETLNLRNALEDRVENHEIREQNREILHALQNRSLGPSEGTHLDLPNVPQYEPHHAVSSTSIHLPDVPQHQPRGMVRPSDSLEDLDTAYRELEALERVLETEGRMIDPISQPSHGNTSPRMTASFISIAQEEVESRLERVGNYQKRMQNMLHRSDTLESASRTGRESLILRSPSMATVRHNDLTAKLDQRTIDAPPARGLISYERATYIPQDGPATGLRIGVPVEQASLGSSSPSHQTTAANRSSSLPDGASIALGRYLAKFQAELDELDQYDVDGQIEKTRAELFDMVQRSLPASPDLRLNPTPSIVSPRLSPNFGGMLSSSPPSSNGMPSPSRRDTFATTTSRRASIAASQWQYLAKDVEVEGIPYSCSKCTKIESTALQMAQRPSGGLSFRILCVSATHKLSDGLLFRHDLSSSVPAYPHVYPSDADEGKENYVRILGPASRLEACSNGQQVALKVQPTIGLCYKFDSTDDSQYFQQVVRGSKLLDRFDVESVTSSEYTGHPTRHVVVRIWDSVPSGTRSIMFYASLIDKYEPFGYIETMASFSAPSGSGTKVKLKMTDNIKPILRHKRANSRDSGVSGMSTGSDDATLTGVVAPIAAAKIKWIEIKFQDNKDKAAFLNLWRGQDV